VLGGWRYHHFVMGKNVQPVRPWVLLAVPLAAEFGRLSAGSQGFDFSTASAIFYASLGLVGLLWRFGRVRSANARREQPSPPPTEAVGQQELEELRRDNAHLVWVTNLQERLLQQSPAPDDGAAEDGAAILVDPRRRTASPTTGARRGQSLP
jgi:hypothetical protein